VAFVQTVPVDRANGDVRAMYERIEAAVGYVPNYAKLFSHRPQVMATWAAFLASIRGNMDPRRYELVTLAAARALQCSYCMLAHGAILRRDFYPADQLTEIARDPAAADLAPAEVAMMAFVEKLARDANGVTRADVQALRDHGLTDAEIFDIAAAAAARCFFSKLLDSLGAEADGAYDFLEDPLRQMLTPGRPMSQEALERVPDAEGRATPPAR
jgi:uncharacterized peroxidase-related enzyme